MNIHLVTQTHKLCLPFLSMGFTTALSLNTLAIPKKTPKRRNSELVPFLTSLPFKYKLNQ